MSVSLQYSFHVLLLILLFSSTDTQAHGNISLGSSITAGQHDDSYWKSPLGHFAFGFRKVNNDGYLVAIWFNNVPENPIVWSGNRNNLVDAGSTLELTGFGWLVINDSSGITLRITNFEKIEIHHAALFDSGNLVLASRDSVIVWESFREPTDTMLPSQTLDIGQELIARYSEQNYSNGRFKFTLQPDGNLHLYTTKYPFKDSRSSYWSTMTSVGSGYQVIYNHSGYMNLIARNGRLLNSIFSDAVSTEDCYQRATIDHDGVFRLYVYPKKKNSHSESLNAWRTLSFIPSDICMAVTEIIGSGTCGLNSYCTLDGGKPSCECPPGYILLDPNDKNKGCKQNFVSQSCNETMNDSDNFEFKEMPNTDWAFSDDEEFEFVSEDWCKQACLTDCHCGLILYEDDKHCYKKKLPMSNGRTGPSVRGKTLIKVRKENNSTLPASDSEKKGPTVVIIDLLVFGCSVFLNIAFLVATLIFLFNRNRQRQKMFQSLQLMPGINLRSFTYNELEAATGRFKVELGSGNFGTVYKAILENGERVAVKKSDKMASVAEQEFQAEVCAIGRTNHKNLVKLIGFCNEDKHRLLVYEYMSNGCLANHLFGTSRLNFFTRLQIALDVARGICYLHQECNLHIIHCDIKPQNILLDESLTAKVSDFGQAKLLKIDKSRRTTVIRGTRGYVAPEWFLNMPITAQVDVHSFGILLLQLICCRQFLDMNENDTKQATLADWANQCYKEGKLQALVEGDEEAMRDMLKVERYVMVAMWCTQENPSIRPTVKIVVHMLEGVVQVPIPPRPYSFYCSI